MKVDLFNYLHKIIDTYAGFEFVLEQGSFCVPCYVATILKYHIYPNSVKKNHVKLQKKWK
jgi:hypothetical protein